MDVRHNFVSFCPSSKALAKLEQSHVGNDISIDIKKNDIYKLN